MNKQLQQLEKEIQTFSDYFVKRYFDCEEPEVWWVADEVGHCLHVNDYFFSLEDMMNFVRHKYSVEDMFEYYEYNLELGMKDETSVCIRDWKKLNK